ncbi:MAG: hypothetical protein HYS34_04160, partial [Acidobacteria bacterium]|nr:hypothetical protein [Acidobacteriota bacterium]
MPANAKGGGRERAAPSAAPPKTPARTDGAARGDGTPRREGAARRLTYKDAGVDIDAKMRAIQRIRLIARGTFKKGVMTDIGSFGGLYDLTAAGPLRHPVLV